MHNLAEGFDAGTHPELVRFFKIARRSASEVQSELYLAFDRNYINQEELTAAYDLATETKRLMTECRIICLTLRWIFYLQMQTSTSVFNETSGNGMIGYLRTT